MRLAPCLGLAALLAASGCLPDASSSPPTAQDRDGDGVLDAEDCAPVDPHEWWERTGFADADQDGRGAGPPTLVCSGNVLPPGWAAVDGDCDDADRSAWTVHAGHADDDGDGVGAGPWLELCAGAYPPRALSSVTGDCAPDDRQRWQERAFLYRDGDDDGVTVPSPGLVCSGAALPDGCADLPSGVDCDDGDPAVSVAVDAYEDVDGDGAGAGVPSTLCTAGSLPVGWSSSDGDCAPNDPARRREAYFGFRDADLDARTVAQPATLCLGDDSAPPGYLPVASGNDCDDSNDEIWEVRRAVADTDRDGYGAGEVVSLCAGAALPDGWLAPGGALDCAPDDRERWRTWTYAYRDADGDTHTVAASGTLCVGSAPPSGYATSATGNDCDDADALVWASAAGYADVDLDGVGAGPRLVSCTDGALPPGQVASGTDCAPEDESRWQLLSYALADADGDGFTAPVAPAQVCSGAVLPDPFRAVASGRDCDDGDATVHRAIVGYPDADADGVGTAPRKIFCVAEVEPAGYSRFGWDVDDRDPSVQWDDWDEELALDLP